MKRLAIAAVLAWSAVASSAQQPAGESIEVRVVNVDVVVRDKAGKPVTGLTKDDFEIFENNKKQEITNLYEVRPSAPATAAKVAPQPSNAAAPAATEAPADARRRNIVMFVDNYSLAPFQRDKILKSLQKFIDDSVRPLDQVMLVLCTQQTK